MGRIAALALLLAWIPGCAGPPKAPIPTAPGVELGRFLGDWYVLAHTPILVDDAAYGAVESYRLDPDGSIATTYTFRDGGFDGETKTYTPTAFVPDPANAAVWEMQFVWPFRSEYLIAHLDEGYTQTIVARNARDYVWIMARTPRIPDADYARLVEKITAWGYDTSQLRRVPQR